MFDKVVKSTVAGQVIDQIKQLLADGRLQPGDKLPSERQLAEMLGVSRPSLREALRALEYASVLETRVGEGVFVKCSAAFLDSNIQAANLVKQFELEELLTARRAIEATVIRLAVARADEEDLAALLRLCDAAESQLDDREAFLRNDGEFHAALAEASGNNVLVALLQTMRSLMRSFNRGLLRTREWREEVIRLHRATVERIIAKDETGAIAVMEEHFDNIVSQMKEGADGPRSF